MPGTLFAPGQGPRGWERLPQQQQGERVLALWTAEGGTEWADVTVANSGGANGDQFNVSQTGTDAVKRYTARESYGGSYAIEFATGGTATTPSIGWSTRIGARTEIWFCCYVKFTQNPALEHRILHVHDAAGTAQRCSLSVRADGLLQMLDSTGSTLTGDRTTKPIAIGVWNRVEFHAILNATAGLYEAWLYRSDPNALVADWDDHVVSAANKNLGGPGGTYRFGITGTAVANVVPWFADNLAVANFRIGPTGAQNVRAGTPPPRYAPSLGPRAWERLPRPRQGDLVAAAGGEAHSGATTGEQHTDGASTATKGAVGPALGGTRISGQSTGVKGAAGAASGQQHTAGVAVRGAPFATGVATGQQRTSGLSTGVKGGVAAGSGQQRTAGLVLVRKQGLAATSGIQRATGTTTVRKQALGVTVGEQRPAGLATTTPPPPSGATVGQQRVTGLTTGRKGTISAQNGQTRLAGLATGIHRATATAASGLQRSIGQAVTAKQAIGVARGQQRTVGLVASNLGPTTPPPRWVEHDGGGTSLEDATGGGRATIDQTSGGTAVLELAGTGTKTVDGAAGGTGIIEGSGGV